MKKILIILIAVVAIALVAFFGWYLFWRNPNIPAGEVAKNILPFGSGKNAPLPATGDGQPGTEFPVLADKYSVPTAKLFRIADTPVAGAVVFKKGNQTIVRYVDRATGHIYDSDLATLEKTKITNDTLPKIYEAYFRADGNAVLLRFLKEDSDVVENLSLALTPPKATSSGALYTVSATPLRGNISAVTAGSGNTFFYALRDTSSIVASTFNGTGAKTLLTYPFTDWRLAAVGNSLAVYTKASADASGYAYTLNTANGAFTKILGPLNGLVVIPDTSGNRVLYSYVENNKTRLFARNLVNKAVGEIIPGTLAEKCVWSIKKAGAIFCSAPINDLGPEEPDNWYRGVTHFSDRIWLLDTNTGTAKVLVEPKQSMDIDIDATELKLSLNEDYLIFINKIDLSLWALRLE